MKQKMIPIISIVVGILAFVLTRQYIAARVRALEEYKENLRRQAKVAVVIGAAEDLPKGARIRQGDLAKVTVDQKNASKAVPVDQATTLIDRRLQMPVRKGEPIFWMEIEGGADAGLTLAPLIQPKLRAISIPVAGASAVSGMIQPGDYVDILGTFTLPSKQPGAEAQIATITVLQNVTVLATGQKMAKTGADQRGAAAASYSSVTVEVTPREAELLVFAQQMQGRLTLTLRNPGDNSDERDLPEVNFEHIEKKLPEYNDYRQKNIRRTRGS